LATASAAYSQEQLNDIWTQQEINQVNGDVIDAMTHNSTTRQPREQEDAVTSPDKNATCVCRL